MRNVLLWNAKSSRWGKKCVKMVVKSALETSWASQRVEGRHVESDRSMAKWGGPRVGCKKVEE